MKLVDCKIRKKEFGCKGMKLTSSFFFFFSFFFFIRDFCHVDIAVCIYSTCTFLIVKRILKLIMYSATSLKILTGYSAI